MVVSLLFQLPQELRDRIYHFALLDEYVDFYDEGLYFNFSYMRSFGKPSSSYRPGREWRMRWMLACKSMLYEAVNQFNRHAYCFDEEKTNGILYGEGKGQADLPPRLPTLSREKKLKATLNFGFEVEKESRGNDSEKQRVTLRPSPQISGSILGGISWIQVQAHIQAIQKTSFEHVDLRVRVNDNSGPNWCVSSLPPPESVSEWKVDAVCLRRLGTNSRKIMIFMENPRVNPRDRSLLRAFIVAVPLLQQEIAKEAKALLRSETGTLKDRPMEMESGCCWHLEVKSGSCGEPTGTLEHIGFNRWQSTRTHAGYQLMPMPGLNDEVTTWSGGSHTLGGGIEERLISVVTP